MRYRLVPIAILMFVLSACSLPWGSGVDAQNAVRVIASQGGVVTSADGELTLEIPVGALSEDTNISIAPATVEDLSPELLELTGLSDISDGELVAYDLQPSGLTFDSPIVISSRSSFDLTTTEVPTYNYYLQNENQDVETINNIEITASLEDGTVTTEAQITHFSLLALKKGQIIIELSQIIPRQQPIGQIFELKIMISSEGPDEIYNYSYEGSGGYFTFDSPPVNVIKIYDTSDRSRTDITDTTSFNNPIISAAMLEAIEAGARGFDTGGDIVRVLPISSETLLEPTTFGSRTIEFVCKSTGITTIIYNLDLIQTGVHFEQPEITNRTTISARVGEVVECVAPVTTPTATDTSPPPQPSDTPTPPITSTLTISATPRETATTTTQIWMGMVSVANAFGRYGPSESFLNEYEFKEGQKLTIIGRFGGWLYVQAEGFETPTWIWNGLVDFTALLADLPFTNYNAGLPFTEFAPKPTNITTTRNNDGTVTICWDVAAIGGDDYRPPVVKLDITQDGVKKTIFLQDSNADGCITTPKIDPDSGSKGTLHIGHQRGYGEACNFDLP